MLTDLGTRVGVLAKASPQRDRLLQPLEPQWESEVSLCVGQKGWEMEDLSEAPLKMFSEGMGTDHRLASEDGGRVITAGT